MLDIKSRVVGDVTVLDLFGDIDLDGVRALKDKLQQVRKSGVTVLVINFEGVRMVQSAMPQHLVTPIRAQVGIGAKVAFCAMNTAVGRVISSSMIKPMINIYETVDAAIQNLNSAS